MATNRPTSAPRLVESKFAPSKSASTNTRELSASEPNSRELNGRAQLFAELDRRAAHKRLDGHALAEVLGYTVSYIAKLRKGTARLDVSPGFLRAVATFLGVPALEVFVLAGFVVQTDFGPPASFSQYLDLHFTMMAHDPLIAMLMPTMKEWGLLPLSVKLCIVGLHQMQFQMAEAISAKQQPGADINLKAMRTAIDAVLKRVPKASESKELSSIRVMRKKL